MAGTKIGGITLEIGGDATKLTDELKNVNNDLAKTGAQLKEVSKLMEFKPASPSATQDKISLLNKEIKESKDKLMLLNEEYDRLSKQEGFNKNSREAIALRTEIEKTVNNIQSARNEIANLEKQSSAFTRIKETASAMGEMLKFAGEKIENAGRAIEDVGQKVSVVSTAIAGVGTVATKEFMGFEKSISSVAAAIYNVTDEELKAIEDEARRLGKETEYTAQQAADAFVILSRAGYDASKSIGLASTVLDLATAGELSMADSAKYLTGTLNGFAKQVTVTVDETGELVTEFGEAKDVIKSGDKVFKDSGEAAKYFADLMARGATLAKTDVSQLGEAMSVTASVASGAFGQSAESVTVALLRLADQNIVATQAGTALNQVMSRLYAPTKEAADALDELGISAYDTEGNARDVNEVVDQLNEKLKTLTAEERANYEKAIFAQRGLKAFSQMAASSSEKTADLYSKLSDVNGASETMAEIMRDNLSTKITLLKSALSESAITIGEKLSPTIEKVTEKIKSAAQWFNSLDDQTVENIVQIGLMVAAAGPLVTVIGKLTTVTGQLLQHPVLGTITLITGAIVGLNAVVQQVTDAENAHFYAMRDELKGMKDLRSEAEKTSLEFGNKLITAYQNSQGAMERLGLGQDILIGRLKDCVDETGKVKKGEEDHVQYILNELSNAYGIQAELIDGQIQDYAGLINQIEEVIEKKKAEAVLNAYESVYADALQVEAEALNKVQEFQSKELEVQNKLNDAKKKYDDYCAENNNTLETYKALALSDWENAAQWNAQVQLIESTMNALNDDVNIYEQELQTCKATTKEYERQYQSAVNTTINYERVVSSMATGTTAELSDAMTMLLKNMKTSESATTNALYKQYNDLVLNYQRMKKAAADGSMQISEEQLKTYEQMIEIAAKELNKSNSIAYGIGENLSRGLAKGIRDYAYLAQQEAESVTQSSLKRMQNVAVIKSPSHVTQWFGEMIDKGLAKGLTDNANLPERAAGEVMDASLDAFGASPILGANSSADRYGSSTSNTTNLGGMTFNIYTQPGQNAQEIARLVSREIQMQVNSQKAVFA